MKKILVTGCAGLVGQNLIARIKNNCNYKVIGIDKHHYNCMIFRDVHPEIDLIEANLAKIGEWENSFNDVDIVVLNHAQISSLNESDFIENNIVATENVINICKSKNIKHIIHISSSVINSKADDFYTQTKTKQENLVKESKINFTILRPTLMFGWFDRKHLGWLSKFLKKSPIFPIPGNGKYIRQPLYAGDLCKIIEACINSPKINQSYNISGLEKIYYADLIKLLKKKSKGKSFIIHIPYNVFWLLLKFFSFFVKNPPFTTSQLEALVIPEEFETIDWPDIFNVENTSLVKAFEETFSNEIYSKIRLKF